MDSLDPVDVGAATSRRDNKRRIGGGEDSNNKKKNRDWQKRLHLRKTAVQPPAMQNRDKRGPKKTVEEKNATWPSSHGTSDGGTNPLRFTCSQCKDIQEYLPKDLTRHFEEKHSGNLPAFPCQSCPFTTHDFSYLQVHLLSHKDTFSSCSFCNDNVQRTCSEFSTHLTTHHCSNGKYLCEICRKFSTGDVRAFLEHTCLHNLDLKGANKELLLHIKGKNQFGPDKTTTQTLHCKHCGYEASQKWLIAKHVKSVHACQNGNPRSRRMKKSEEVHSIEATQNDTVPKTKARLTRSAVREMCWLTQDCLALPGREFLDKYCHLSDPQTTLKETQQFLMKSVAGETGDQKWTKALKTVLSNVPQEVNGKSENGIVSNSSDLTVLTVKNKITVGQNGTTYPKKLKLMTSADKESVSNESTAGETEQKECQSTVNDHTPSPQIDSQTDIPESGLNEPTAQTQENRENQELKIDVEVDEHAKKLEGNLQGDGIHDSSHENVAVQDGKEEQHLCKNVPKRPKSRRKRKTRFKKEDKRSPGVPLKIVLKKNPVEKQWVSQCSLSPSRCDSVDGHESRNASIEETGLSRKTEEAQEKKWTKSCDTTPDGASFQSKQEEETAKISTHEDSIAPETPRNTETSTQLSEPDGMMAVSVGRQEVEFCPESFPTSDRLVSAEQSLAADGDAPRHSSQSHLATDAQPVITPQGDINGESSSQDLLLPESSGPKTSVDSVDSIGDLCSSPAVQTLCKDSSPAPSGSRRLQLGVKHLERTLKLVATNPSQPVKRPAGDHQPVVVLNHPDADIPEVARIMEVVNRYRGEVTKVVLSRRTLNAISALRGEGHPSEEGPGCQNAVQERFVLKMKLRRLTRKKYEIVGAGPAIPADAASPVQESVATNAVTNVPQTTEFRCWFCGRLFGSQETWMKHRRRHLMEWNGPNCENS